MGDVPGFASFFQGDVTPTIREQRVLWVRAATFPRRFAAALVDVVIVGGVSAVVTLLAAAALQVPIPAANQLGPDLLLASLLDRNPMALGALGLFLGLGGLYQIYLGGMVGQTLGKRWFGLRVISVRGVSANPLARDHPLSGAAAVGAAGWAGLGVVPVRSGASGGPRSPGWHVCRARRLARGRRAPAGGRACSSLG